ncbi:MULTISPECIES: hypothetical protein [unclassified Streptomyces]|nr:hypothetical protein [Streptomyces sp. V1I1]MDQ0939504.1 hypothetical protein [Streptomyces sp. V1I1]
MKRRAAPDWGGAGGSVDGRAGAGAGLDGDSGDVEDGASDADSG